MRARFIFLGNMRFSDFSDFFSFMDGGYKVIFVNFGKSYWGIKWGYYRVNFFLEYLEF